MKIPKVKASEIFVVATGIAAFFHSTNVLGFLFNAEQPAIENISSWIQFVHFLGWIVPSALIALTLDIGQIATSHEIKQHGLTIPRALTFLTFALATYNLQWVYLSLHLPELVLGIGVSSQYRDASILLLNAQQWIIPALLPLATLLYTFSGDKPSAETMHSETAIPQISIEPVLDKLPPMLEANSAIETHDDSHLLHFEEDEAINLLWCPDCHWNTGEKESMDAAQRALRVHQSRFCKEQHCEVNHANAQ